MRLTSSKTKPVKTAAAIRKQREEKLRAMLADLLTPTDHQPNNGSDTEEP